MQRSVRQYFARFGLSWQKIKKKKGTLDGYRIHTIREFLIELDKFVLGMTDNDNVVPVCIDEFYLHNNHSLGMSYDTNLELMGRVLVKRRDLLYYMLLPQMGLCANEISSQTFRTTTI